MLFFKIFGASLVLLCGLSLARTLNGRAANALSQTEAWARLVASVKSEVECFSLPIGEILARISDGELERLGCSLRTRPRTLSELVAGTRWSDRETEMIARRFCDEFGKSLRDEQVGRCAYFISELEERKKSLASELPAKRKLNSTLCISVCLGLLILFV